MSDTRRCYFCKNHLPLTDFYLGQGKLRKDGSRGPSGRRGPCRFCRVDCARNAQLKTKYGITRDDYEALRAEQGGGCAICGTQDASMGQTNLAVDHDHATGVVRGLLCFNCNIGLGKFQENPELLARAVEYLRADSEQRHRYESARRQLAHA